MCWSFTVVPRGAPFSVENVDTNGCCANDDTLQAVMHIMMHRSEYFAGKTESGLAVNAEADTKAGGWAIVYEEMGLVGADGTQYPLITGQSSSRAGPSFSLEVWRTKDKISRS